MMGKTHYSLGILYYLLFCMIQGFSLSNFPNGKIMIIGMLGAALGAIFPDADSDHSLINNRNPVFKVSNKIINYWRELLKKIFAFIFFAMPSILIIIYMYRENYYSIGLIIFSTILFILAFNGVKVGEKIYIPILTYVLKSINSGAAKLRKLFMMIIYLSLASASIYFSGGNVEGLIWGVIFIFIAIFPHRTFLHSPEGMIIVIIGVMYIEKRLQIPNISTAFSIGYFSHLYLADIFTNSGVPISTIPLILKKLGIHSGLKKYKSYMVVYNILNKKLSIPLIKTGSKLGSIVEGFYVFFLFISLILVMTRG